MGTQRSEEPNGKGRPEEKVISREEIFVRTRALLGGEAMERLYRSKVAVFGIGGVGGHAVEALARSGIGQMDLYDNDTVSLSNINRQLAATLDTVGQYKTDVMKERIARIHPQAQVRVFHCFYLPENAGQFDLSGYDYIVDAVDTVSAKVELIVRAQEAGVPVISCMGAGNKWDPSRFRVADIYETSVCPLARIMRRELRARGVKSCPVVYSEEEPQKPAFAPGRLEADGWQQKEGERTTTGFRARAVPGSNAFVPAVAGLMMAGEVVCTLAGVGRREAEKEKEKR